MNKNLEADFMAEYLAAKKKVDAVLASPFVTRKDIRNLSGPETEYLYKQIEKTYDSLEGEERDRFLTRIRPLLADNCNREWWEHNHSQITSTIEKLVGETGRMPSKTTLARQTGLSRQTIAKHLKAHAAQPARQTEMERLKSMAPALLSAIYNRAIAGDNEAARVYFEMVSGLGS